MKSIGQMFGLPERAGDPFVFAPNNINGAYNWHTWTKPRGISLVWLLGIAGAGSGGGGRTGTTGSPRGGGAGGGSAGVNVICFPAFLLPDVLFVAVGLGGAAVGAGTAGNPGGQTYVADSPYTSAQTSHTYLFADCGLGGQPGAGGQASGGSGGAAKTVTGNAMLSAIALSWFYYAGQTGGAGGNAANGAGDAVAAGNNTPFVTSGGAGGGGVTTDTGAWNGGNIQASGPIPANIPGGTGHVASPACDGLAGFYSHRPFCRTGGSGGGCNGAADTNGGVGGFGGPGGLGGGGGGGGGGITGGTSGKGGDGILMIWVI